MLLGASVAATVVAAQTTGQAPTLGFDIPANAQFFGEQDGSVRKATAIVNGGVITGTDVDQRLALIVLANGGNVPADELPRLRAQVLRNLVDELLQIQAAEAEEIKVEPKEIEAYYERYAQNFRRKPQEFSEYLRANGSSDRSIKQQIHGEIAWSRLQSRQIRPFVSVSDEEVQVILERMKAAKGTEEIRIAEIFLSASPETAPTIEANARRIIEQIRQGGSFLAYARQFSEASTAALGGDLGWVRPERLPDALADVARQLQVGQISEPIPVQGGYSIIAMQDKRQVLMQDPRDAVLSLKQLAISFPAGTTREQAAPLVEQLAKTSQGMGGCGGAEAAAAKIGAEVVESDAIKVRDIGDPRLEEQLLRLNVGQATPPFGSFEQGVRVLVLCGRDEPEATDGPSAQQIYAELDEQRTNMRARRYLRDLRRDAVVDYR